MTQSIWSKLFTALRGGANEVGEAIADQQALRILDQEIRDADSALSNARRELVTIMAGGNDVLSQLSAVSAAVTAQGRASWSMKRVIRAPQTWPQRPPSINMAIQ